MILGDTLSIIAGSLGIASAVAGGIHLKNKVSKAGKGGSIKIDNANVDKDVKSGDGGEGDGGDGGDITITGGNITGSLIAGKGGDAK